jgi:dihydropyrimidinase
MKINHADTAIKGGTLVNSQGMRPADIFIKDGIIASIAPGESRKKASSVIDATGKYVLPGIVDAHLHPVYADRMDTLSKAAPLGGITTLIPYIGAIKAWGKTGNLIDAVQDFIAEGEKSSIVDFGAHCSLTLNDMDTIAETIPAAIELGVNSFKVFMAYARRGMKIEDEHILKIMEIIAANKALLAVHAENGSIIDHLEDKFITQGNLGPEFFSPSHPNISEAEAIFRILALSETVKCPLYLAHISAHESLDVLKLYREWGKNDFFTETCTHYLAFTENELLTKGSLAKMAPPLRKKVDRDALWRAVADGLIDVIGSDAAGHTIEDKEPIRDNIFKSPNGIPGLETMFTVAYDEGVNKDGITLPRLVELTCENPAKIFGLYPRKGVLQKGSDADVVVFDPDAVYTVTTQNSPLKVDYSLYEGRECVGLPSLVMQRGRILLEEGRLRGDPGQGNYIPAYINTSYSRRTE